MYIGTKEYTSTLVHYTMYKVYSILHLQVCLNMTKFYSNTCIWYKKPNKL